MQKSRLIWLLLAAYALLLGCEAWRVGVTFDEPSHLAAAYMYWRGRDVLLPSDSPPLMRIISGWAPRLMRAPLREDTRAWQTQSSYEIGGEMLEALGAAAKRRLLFRSRLCFLVFPLLLVWLLWHWGRQLFSERTALVIVLCAILEPTLLGHGSLIKSDVAAAFGYLLFFYTAWRYWRRPDCIRAAIMSAGLLLAVLAKFNLLVLIPIALLLILRRGPRLAGAAMALATVYLGLLASYQFRVRPISQAEIMQMKSEGFSRPEIAVARTAGRLPWPPQFIRGLRYIGQADRGPGFPAYMLGRKIEYAAPWYFPLAWAVKFPIGLQLLTLAGAAALAARAVSGKAGVNDWFVWGPAALMAALVVRSHIHLGFRHALPALPFLLLGAGFAFERWGGGSGFRLGALACIVWLAVASLRIYPQGISYFNEWAGGPENGWKYLADSNLDWGQNLPELQRYVVKHNIQKIMTYYFGTDILRDYIPDDKLVVQAAPWAPEWEKETRLAPAPGVYAISVNTLLGYFFSPAYQDYFAYFKSRRPDGRAGYSIFIYRVEPVSARR
jgi:hypothetical protein